MNNEVIVFVKDVTQENFAIYGNLIDSANKTSDVASEVFDYWDGLGEVDTEGKVAFGMVSSHPGPLIVTNLERHLKTSETLIPMTGEIVLVVAAATESVTANLSSIAAFRVSQGKAVTLKRGTWHYVPINADQEVKTMVVFRAGTADDDLFVDDFNKNHGVVVKVKI